MKITVSEEEGRGELEVVIRCARMDDAVLEMLAYLRQYDKRLVGSKDGRSFVIDPKDVYYFESVDKKTFLYTRAEVYETPLRLYELEQRLQGAPFFRATKATIVNLAKIRSFNSRPLCGGKIEIVLENDERLVVSRGYVRVLKEKLGI